MAATAEAGVKFIPSAGVISISTLGSPVMRIIYVFWTRPAVCACRKRSKTSPSGPFSALRALLIPEGHQSPPPFEPPHHGETGRLHDRHEAHHLLVRAADRVGDAIARPGP